MSVVTRQPDVATRVPSKSNAPPPTAVLPDPPRDGPGRDATAPVERRRSGGPADSPMEILSRLPAVVVLERLPVPSLAMARDGIILFANRAFAEMVGYELEALAGSVFPEMFHTVPATLCAVSGVDAVANLIVELRHCEGWTVRARMSQTAMLRQADPVVLVTFDNLTERLWMDER